MKYYWWVLLFVPLMVLAGETEQAIDNQIDAKLDSVKVAWGISDSTTPPVTPPPIEPPPVEPPPPPPIPGTVLYENDFEGSDPFKGWLGRNTSTNLKVITEGSNKIGRLIYDPHSDWICSFLPRREGVFDIEMTFACRLPTGFRYKRNSEGQIIGGGKHFVQLTSANRYKYGNDVLIQDGRTRLDFGQEGEFGNWQCTAYRELLGGGRPGEFAHRFERGEEKYFLPLGTWKTVRIRIHLNSGLGDNGGTNELIFGDHSLGTMRGEFNVVGSIGGITAFGFGNLDNVEGDPWVDIDNLKIVAR